MLLLLWAPVSNSITSSMCLLNRFNIPINLRWFLAAPSIYMMQTTCCLYSGWMSNIDIHGTHKDYMLLCNISNLQNLLTAKEMVSEQQLIQIPVRFTGATRLHVNCYLSITWRPTWPVVKLNHWVSLFFSWKTYFRELTNQSWKDFLKSWSLKKDR